MCGGNVRATFASGKPLVQLPSSHWGFVQFLPFMGIYLFPRSRSHTGREAVPQQTGDHLLSAGYSRWLSHRQKLWVGFILVTGHHCYSTASSIAATGKGLLGPCTTLYFPHSPIAETDWEILAGDGVGTARNGHAGVWPSMGSAESRRPHACSLPALIGPIGQSWQIPTQLGSGPVMSLQSHTDSPYAVIPAFKNSWY